MHSVAAASPTPTTAPLSRPIPKQRAPWCARYSGVQVLGTGRPARTPPAHHTGTHRDGPAGEGEVCRERCLRRDHFGGTNHGHPGVLMDVPVVGAEARGVVVRLTVGAGV